MAASVHALCLTLLCALCACDGFTEVADTGTGQADGNLDGAGDAMATDGAPALDAAPADSSSSILSPGSCCSSPVQCAEGNCYAVGQGPSYCASACKEDSDCPVGFGCSDSMNLCVPPSGNYACIQDGPAPSAPQGLGGCCGKKEDCASGHCVVVGQGQYFCTESCTQSPDSCAAGFVCSTAGLCATPGESGCIFR